jgi:hypothetical protein
LKQKGRSEIAKKIEAKRCKMKQKEHFFVSQKKAKPNKMRFASFCFEAKIKTKERKRDTLIFQTRLPRAAQGISSKEWQFFQFCYERYCEVRIALQYIAYPLLNFLAQSKSL